MPAIKLSATAAARTVHLRGIQDEEKQDNDPRELIHIKGIISVNQTLAFSYTLESTKIINLRCLFALSDSSNV